MEKIQELRIPQCSTASWAPFRTDRNIRFQVSVITAIEIFIDNNERRKWLSELNTPSNICYKAWGMRNMYCEGVLQQCRFVKSSSSSKCESSLSVNLEVTGNRFLERTLELGRLRLHSTIPISSHNSNTITRADSATDETFELPN
jgi:hypothetical protein